MAQILQDPIIIVASLVILAAIIILIWAAKNLYDMRIPVDEIPYDDPSPVQQTQTNDNSGISEARNNEVSNQLGIIINQLNEIEKKLNSKRSPDDTISNMQVSPEIGQLSAKLDSVLAKLDTAPTGNSGSGPAIGKDTLERLETKIDSVRKLLVLLSDSNKPGE